MQIAQQFKLLGRNGVKQNCVVCVPDLLVPVFSSFLEGFAFLSGMHAPNVKLLKAHWHECSIEAMSYSYLTP